MTYLADRLRFVFEVFNHRGDNEDAAEESPGLLEILTPVKLKEKNLFFLICKNQ